MFGLLLCGLLLSDKAELIQKPSTSKSDNLEVQAGGLMLRDGEAGAAFGAVRVGKGKRTLSYFAVLKHELGKAEKSDLNEEANADDKSGDTKQTLSLDGKSIEIVYKVKTDGDKVTESLTITTSAGKKEFDDLKKSGRVLLVDLTASPPTWELRKAESVLEKLEVEADNKKATEELAKSVLEKLAKQDKKIKEFIDKAKN